MLLVAETRDTLGVPIFGFVATAANPAPFLCIRDVWKGIAAMLDSAEADLNAGQTRAIADRSSAGVRDGEPGGAEWNCPALSPASIGRSRRTRNFNTRMERRAVTGGTRATVSTPGSPLVSALTSADSGGSCLVDVQPGGADPSHRGRLFGSHGGVSQLQLDVGRRRRIPVTFSASDRPRPCSCWTPWRAKIAKQWRSASEQARCERRRRPTPRLDRRRTRRRPTSMTVSFYLTASSSPFQSSVTRSSCSSRRRLSWERAT